jgi:hypothetical protein
MPVELNDSVEVSVSEDGSFKEKQTYTYTIIEAKYSYQYKPYFPYEDPAPRYHIVVKKLYTVDPDKGIISNESPVGRNLLGADVGDVVVIRLPSNRSTYYRIEKIIKGDGNVQRR